MRDKRPKPLLDLDTRRGCCVGFALVLLGIFLFAVLCGFVVGLVI